MVDVSQNLIIRVGVDRGHDAVFDTNRFVQGLHQRCQTVRRTRSIRDNRMIRCQILVVDAKDERAINIRTTGS